MNTNDIYFFIEWIGLKSIQQMHRYFFFRDKTMNMQEKYHPNKIHSSEKMNDIN